MKRTLAAVILWAAFLTRFASAGVYTNPYQQAPLESVDTSNILSAMPKGNSTTLGGEIIHIDSVRDELTLKVFGRRPTKILFDERTQVYRDGKHISLRDLGTTSHASVQTVLDGTDVFALSIHMLSQSPDGDVHGTILNFNPETMELTLTSNLLSDPIRLLLPADVDIQRTGQGQFTSISSGKSDLVRGTLIAATFRSDKNGRGVARKITILATPGSIFVFSGTLFSLDMHTGVLVVMGLRDNNSYQIFFDPSRLTSAHHLHQGAHIKVVAMYDGARYLAREISAN